MDRDDFARHLEAIRGARRPGCELLLTFDDGGLSAYTPVATMLEENAWRGYFFVTTGCIGPPGFWNDRQIRELDKRGHVIGSHSCSHPGRMSREPRGEVAGGVEGQHEASGVDRLACGQGRVGAGYCSRRVAEAAAAAGIETLFTSEPTARVGTVNGAASWAVTRCNEAWDRNGRPDLLPVSRGPVAIGLLWKAKGSQGPWADRCTCGYARLYLGGLRIGRIRVKRPMLLAGVASIALLSASAQDLTITNARIIVANGTVIERGSIVVHGGKIASVAAGTPSAASGRTIDAKGMTAMPGFIDAHKHINTGPEEKAQMQALLEAGYTTILSGSGPAEGNLTLRDHIEKGVINGPRIIPSGQVRLRDNTPEMARAQLKKMAEMGIKFTGEIGLNPEPGPTEQEMEVLRAIVDEGKKDGVYVQVHAVSSRAMMAAIDAGVRLLVHLPNKDWVTRADALKLAATGTNILGTIGFGAPVFGVFANDNKPRFRDGKPWPESIVGADLLDGVAVGQEAGFTIVNARTIWDAGGILGYCTDTGYEPRAGLEHELKSYNVVFSMQDLVKLMGPNTASYIQMSSQLGTLEAGRLADLILVDGNPLEGYWNWLKAKVVVKGGVVVVNKL